MIGEVFGSKTLVKLATDANPNLRAHNFLFLPLRSQDQIIALGVTITRRLPVNLKRTSLSRARYWAGPESTWAHVAN